KWGRVADGRRFAREAPAGREAASAVAYSSGCADRSGPQRCSSRWARAPLVRSRRARADVGSLLHRAARPARAALLRGRGAPAGRPRAATRCRRGAGTGPARPSPGAAPAVGLLGMGVLLVCIARAIAPAAPLPWRAAPLLAMALLGLAAGAGIWLGLPLLTRAVPWLLTRAVPWLALGAAALGLAWG